MLKNRMEIRWLRPLLWGLVLVAFVAPTAFAWGPEVSNSGALAANGGDADPSLAGSVGGDGAEVNLDSPDGMPGITQTGTVTNDGGTGATPGDDGDYYLGGLLQ